MVILFAIYRAIRRPQITRHGRPIRKSPNSLPIVGNGLLFLRPREELLVWFTRCGYETLSISIPTLPPGVIISDPANLEYVFQHEEKFQKGDFFGARLQDLFGYGIVNVDGNLWKQQRKAGTKFFTTSMIRTLTHRDLPELLQQAVSNLHPVARGSMVVDLECVFHEITTQLIGRLAYDTDMHADDHFTQAFDHASGEIAKRFQNPLWRFTELVTGARLRSSIQIMKKYGQKLVEQAEQCEDSNNESTLEKTPSLIHILLDHLCDRSLVADSALNYLSAGKDTIAQALTWTFYLLSEHQDVSTRIFHLVKTNNIAVINHEHLSSDASHFILAVFYEALRLYPPIPIELKQAQEDTLLPDGTFIPQNSVVLWCTWAMNRSTLTWGDDAKSFRPDRWLHEGVLTHRSAAEFPVFQGGARLCLGKRMAELIAIQIIATLTNAYVFTPAFNGAKTSRTYLTMPMEGGLQMRVEHRQR
ncbi:Ff.00g010980.m01.CDS01 [Fusarium sp. VM40]|nr:Ff.00g010980.m01.CDS01 [Fusarium sp. VM40]